MKLKFKPILLSVMLLAVLALLCGCAQEGSPYDQNDAEGNTLSVRFDANGGYFTTNTSVIVDSYNPAGLPVKDGKASVALLPPDHEARGNDAFAPIHNGYFLAGWYAERVETKDAEGNISYTYGKKWDFEADRLEVDANGSYTASQPVLTLYAAWVPLFQIEFYDASSGEYLDVISFDPTQKTTFQMPAWNKETGAMDMYDFPERSGHTYQEAFYAQSDAPIADTQLIHPGKVDAATGTATDSVLKLKVSYREGEWYRITTADQLLNNASVTGSYEILADLDFTDKIWPTALMYGNYSGTIQGNGHTLKNIQLKQTNNSKVNAGLFGMLTDTACIQDLKLDHVTFTVAAGTRVAGTSYGLLAGTVSAQAKITDVIIQNSTLQVDSGCYFGTEEYAIGLICGTGNPDIDPAGISVKAVGKAPGNVKIKVEGQTVSVEIAFT